MIPKALRALVAREMLASGDVLVPTLHGEPFYTKPPLHYALIALCSAPGGAVTEVSARLPSALAATLTVLLFYFHFRHWLGARGGLTAALLLPLSYLWLEKASAAQDVKKVTALGTQYAELEGLLAEKYAQWEQLAA